MSYVIWGVVLFGALYPLANGFAKRNWRTYTFSKLPRSIRDGLDGWNSYPADKRTTQRIIVLQRIVNYECRQYHVAAFPRVRPAVLKEGTHGIYSHAERTISISDSLLDQGARECVSTVLHEFRHCYQHNIADMLSTYIPKESAPVFTEYVWMQNFMDYKHCTETAESLQQYYDQPVEVDARKFARDNIHRYCY